MLVRLLILAAFLAVGCRAPASSDNTFRMVLSNEPPTLDWSLATDSVSITVIENLMDGLTRFDQDLRPAPAVASSWDVSADGRRYLFHLRPDVRWSDGAPVTAADFEYAWKRLLDPKTAAQYAYFLYPVANAKAYNTGALPDASTVGVRALSATELEVVLDRPIAYFPSLTTFMVTFPQRRDLIERYGDRWTDPGRLVTNGPFRLESWRHEYRLQLSANPTYYGGKPAIGHVAMYVVNERTTELTLYETGDLDYAQLPPEAIPAFEGSPDHRRLPILRGYYAGFNVTKPPFTDPRVRRAFALALDREEFPKILRGGERAARSWVPPGMFGYEPDIGLPYDPERARRLLAEAGFPGGRGLPPIEYVFNTGPVNTLIAENLQAQWKRNLGVDVRLDNVEWKVYLKRLEQDAPGMFRLGWGADYPDPDNFLALFTKDSGNNHSRWANARYDALIAEASSESDPARRLVMYREAQRLLTEEDVPIIPLFTHVQNMLVKPWVRGLDVNAMEIMSLQGVSIGARP
ncbi:MAG TPA: peptide ABC transporter substrate-binding protein [Nitrospiria bacterium]|nr:peptide ABC transporter substrate-binding protein [Nitrospiria bacterium]